MARITENQWVNYFGFQRFPFDRAEAGNEEFSRPEFLATCFVEPDSFGRVFGQADSPTTSLLFSARGTGKTACRVMMNYYCQEGLVHRGRPDNNRKYYVLSVPHIRLDQVIDFAHKTSNTNEILIEYHAEEILRQAVPAFVSLLAKVHEFSEEIKKLSAQELRDLSWLIARYSHYLTAPQVTFLSELGIDPFETRPMKELLENSASAGKSPAWINVLLKNRDEASPLSHIELWCRLARRLGILSTYILVDGIDEVMQTADNPQFGYEIIRPLLTNLRLMDSTPYLALKFFLPSQIEPFLNADKAFRRDRGFVIETIVWVEEDLIKLLRNRIDALKRPDSEIRDRTVAGFDALCVPELREQIEHDLAEQAKGNPRHLMNLCAQMVVAHCGRDIQNQDDPYQLNREDLLLAQRTFDTETKQAIQILEKNQPDILALIAQGESETVEFKSSIRYDYKRQSVNKDELGLVVAKTIAGLMNRLGGILIIGVNDEGRILGIEKDLESLAKRNVDGFQLALKDIVKTYLGMECAANLHLHFETIADRIVCAVKVQKSSAPVYVKIGDTSEFYVRMLNSTAKLGLPETVSYIHSHWKK